MHVLRCFYFSRKKKRNNSLPVIWEVHECSVILEYFTRVFCIFAWIFPSSRKFSNLLRDARVNWGRKEGSGWGCHDLHKLQYTDLLSWSISFVAKIAFSHLPRKVEKDHATFPHTSSVLYYLSILRGHPQSIVLVPRPLSGLTAWDLSRSIFVCVSDRPFSCIPAGNLQKGLWTVPTMLLKLVQVKRSQIFVDE